MGGARGSPALGSQGDGELRHVLPHRSQGSEGVGKSPREERGGQRGGGAEEEEEKMGKRGEGQRLVPGDL